MTIQEILSEGVYAAEVTRFVITDFKIEDIEYTRYEARVKDLLREGYSYDMQWEFENEFAAECGEEELGLSMLAMANQDLEDFRNEEG